MAKKKCSITVAGGGSTFYTRYRIDALRSIWTDSQFVPSKFYDNDAETRNSLKHVRSI